MIQRLALAPRLFPLVRHNVKHSTIRTGYRDIKPGVLEFYAPEGSASDERLSVTVTQVRHTLVGNLTHDDAAREGHGSVENLVAALTTHYPSALLQPESPITIIEFTQAA